MTSRLELEFANAPAAALRSGAPRTGRLLLACVAALVAATAAWAAWAIVEEVATGLGRVIPSQQMQVVQSLEGGIVRELTVREGDKVEKDQVLMRIDDTGFASRFGEINQRRLASLAEIARLEAEAQGDNTIKFGDEVKANAPQAIASETDAFAARAQKLQAEIELLNQQLLQRRQELAEIDAREAKLDAELGPLQSELSINRQLAKSGNVARVDVLRIERQIAELQGERAVVIAAKPRVRAAAAEAQQRIDGAANAFRAQARERLSVMRSDLAVIEESIKAAKDRVVRAAVRSPVKGVVNRLSVTTIGAVVQPGQALLEIVPADDTLLVEARVRPKDVAFIRPEQAATVKITAYDYLVYGSLAGKVLRISPDTIRDERGEPYYQVIVQTGRNFLGGEESPLPVMPGLLATVDILTGEKSVMSYLLKPILRVRKEALRER
jgi:adhesin transport system membrane fusion protein